MEAVGADCLLDAKSWSRRLLSQHLQADRAELFDGDRKVATIRPKDAPRANHPVC